MTEHSSSVDGFNAGEKTETYWAMPQLRDSHRGRRSNPSVYWKPGRYGFKKSGYDSRFRTGHYDGKGRVGEWILFQNQVNSQPIESVSSEPTVT